MTQAVPLQRHVWASVFYKQSAVMTTVSEEKKKLIASVQIQNKYVDGNARLRVFGTIQILQGSLHLFLNSQKITTNPQARPS